MTDAPYWLLRPVTTGGRMGVPVETVERHLRADGKYEVRTNRRIRFSDRPFTVGEYTPNGSCVRAPGFGRYATAEAAMRAVDKRHPLKLGDLMTDDGLRPYQRAVVEALASAPTPKSSVPVPRSAPTRTIHDDVREKVELAFTYAEDGAFLSGARVLEEAAAMYRRRGDAIERGMK